MGYMHIDNLYKNSDILMFRECYAMEKIHGTSAHVSFSPEGITFFAGGANHESFVALFDQDKLMTAYRATDPAGRPTTVYGEAYGGKMQGMSGTYGKELRFVAFEVKIGEHCYLSVPDAEQVATGLGFDFVSYAKASTDIQALDAEMMKDSNQAVKCGMGAGHMREGVVLRPLIEVRKNNGERIIAKHKRPEFQERMHQPKPADANRLQVLSDAKAIADEWVTPMRMTHVLDGIPQPHDMTKCEAVIKGMIADVEREAKGEILESKDVRKAIGARAIRMYKDGLKP